jgi:hypothetical protein
MSRTSDCFAKFGASHRTHVKQMFKDTDPDVRRAALEVYEKFANEFDLMDISIIYAEGLIVNRELLDCIIKLDEKIYSQKL